MPSLRYRTIQHFCRYTSSKKTYALRGPEFYERVVESPRNVKMAPAPERLIHHAAHRSDRIADTECVIFEPAGVEARECAKLPVAMFIPGGGFVFHAGNIQWRFCADIVRESGIVVLMVDYPTAPDHSCMQALDTLKEVYLELDAKAEDGVAVFGDSSGGGLALSLCMQLREDHLPQPRRLVMVSPAVSLAYEGTPGEIERYRKLRETDPVLSTAAFPDIVRWWGSDLDDHDWHVSPLYGDLTGLPPMSVYTGTRDVLNVAARKLLRAAGKQRAPITYVERPGMMHDYVVLHCPEGNRDRSRICKELGI